MATIPTRLMTAEEFARLPDDGKMYELVEGRPVELAGSGWLASTVAATILTLLNVFVREHKLGKVSGADLGAKLGSDPDTVRLPDVAFIRAERFPSGKGPLGFVDGAPDLCIEVLSPSNRYRAVQRKVREYFTAGAQQVWVFDPEERSAVVHRADGSAAEYGADGVIDGGDLLPGFTLNLAEVWEDSEDGESAHQ